MARIIRSICGPKSVLQHRWPAILTKLWAKTVFEEQMARKIGRAVGQKAASKSYGPQKLRQRAQVFYLKKATSLVVA